MIGVPAIRFETAATASSASAMVVSAHSTRPTLRTRPGRGHRPDWVNLGRARNSSRLDDAPGVAAWSDPCPLAGTTKGTQDADLPGRTRRRLNPTHRRHANRRASLPRRRRGRRDREHRLRPPGPRPRGRCVPPLVPGRVDAGDPPGISRRRRRRRRRPAVLGPDGFALPVPDRERRHRLLPELRRPQRRARRLRSPAGHPRAGQRHVVPLGDRRRPSRPGPRHGRTIPPGRARVRRAAPRGRVPGRPLDHERRLPSLPRVHGGQRPGPDGGEDQAGHEDLPVRAGDLRDQHRRASWPARRR